MMTDEKPPSRALVFLVVVIALMLGSSYLFGTGVSAGNSASAKSGHAQLTPLSGGPILPKGQQVSVFSGYQNEPAPMGIADYGIGQFGLPYS
ncbi:MAG: thermopsin [Thermoplasmatales archaeon]|nr:thermopsin [Thermoplasmatales archaeon]